MSERAPDDLRDLQSEVSKNHPLEPHLFQLLVKNGEYIYARPFDIVLLESNDHWVKVYLAFGGQLKITLRNDSLKKFLETLSNDDFIRLGRFCAVNVRRLSGGNYNEQTFEFDFRVKIKLSHPLDRRFFSNIGK